MAALMTACSAGQKQASVEVPVSQIDIEQLVNGIDYDMDISALSLGDVMLLRNAPAALRGYPFKDAYLRGIYSGTTWYDSLTWKFDAVAEFIDVEEREGESWRDYYYRAAEEGGLLKYTAEELAFMKRLKEREDELKAHNFDVDPLLRVNMQNLANPMQMKEFDSLLCRQLAQDGFAIVPGNHEQLFHLYEQNDYNCFPSFITTDLFLQLFHLYFDCVLREAEEQTLSPLIIDYTLKMYHAMHQQAVGASSSELGRLAHHNAVFFAVAYQLFTGMLIGTPDEQAEAKPEVESVLKAENGYSQFMADYKMVEFPYSLFRPRGHYSRNDVLKRYFRGMMWLQSVPFGMDNDEEVREAVVLACLMKEQEDATRSYERIDQLLTYLMGKSDNLSIPQVQAEVAKIGKPLHVLLASESDMARLKKALNDLGEKQTRIRPKFERTSRNKICLLPQRYQPDAEVLQEMVDHDSTPTKRATPQGLDIFASMGVMAAEQILVDAGQEWKDFKPMLAKMKERMNEIDWNETIATQWMRALRGINEGSAADNMPYFMGTPEWGRKDLNAMLASWAELKHDAILYAKQPMGAECGGGGIPDPVVKGYVEPNVTFWKKAVELFDNTSELLKGQGLLSERLEQITTRIREEAQFLLSISRKELEGTPLTDEEYDQLKCKGATFENISLDIVRQPDQYLMGWSDVEGADRQVALVADVYTANSDNNPDKSILYEGVGAADEIFVVVEIDGYLYLTRGAVFSYREFKQPVGEQRLTDEEWQQQLEKNPRKGVPEWMNRIIVPLKNAPVPNEELFYSSGC